MPPVLLVRDPLQADIPVSASHGHALSPCRSPSFLSDVPKGANTFGVSGSSEVKIYMVYDPARVAEPTGRAHWPLDANVDVVVVADKASKDLNDLKVSITQASLYLILCRLGNIPTETQASCTPTSHSTQEQPGHPSDPHRSVTPSSCPQTSVLPQQESVATLI